MGDLKKEIRITLFGIAVSAVVGLVAALVGSFLVDANTEKTTNVQLIQVAIGILSKDSDAGYSTEQKVLRAWAVDTINSSAKVKFDSRSKQLLVDGKAAFPSIREKVSEVLKNVRLNTEERLKEQAVQIEVWEQKINEMTKQAEEVEKILDSVEPKTDEVK